MNSKLGEHILKRGNVEAPSNPKRLLIKVADPTHLRRTGSIALIVGTWLTLFNQGDVIWTDGLDVGVAIKIVLNYLTPFVVANLGLLTRKTREKGK